MAFRKQYKRFYKKKAKFSKNNLYRNRSSKKQALQIYRLNRKINYIEKKTKPEISEGIFSTTLSSEFLEKNSAQLQETTDLFKTLKTNMKGELVRLQNIRIYGGFTSNLNEYPKDFTILSSYIRLIVLQNKTENQTFPGEPLLSRASTGLSCIRSPYMSGFSQTCRILYDRVYKIDHDTPEKTFSFNIKKMNNLRKLLYNNTATYTGDIKIYAYMYSKTGLFDEGSFPGTSTVIKCNLNAKIVYIDEN